MGGVGDAGQPRGAAMYPLTARRARCSVSHHLPVVNGDAETLLKRSRAIFQACWTSKRANGPAAAPRRGSCPDFNGHYELR
jgi:hypothetical protein